MPDEIFAVCFPCGKKYGRKDGGIASCWHGICDICECQKTICAARNFGYIDPEKLEQRNDEGKVKA